jgi:hypothetical protein
MAIWRQGRLVGTSAWRCSVEMLYFRRSTLDLLSPSDPST